MSIRKIKAHDAKEDGDYIRIEKHSTWPYWVAFGIVAGCLLGILIVKIGVFHGVDDFTVMALCTISFVVLGLLIGGEKEIRRVPKTDLVEIKRYASGRVTVVLDDERVKRPPFAGS